jgi:signal transduction histidine kinase
MFRNDLPPGERKTHRRTKAVPPIEPVEDHARGNVRLTDLLAARSAERDAALGEVARLNSQLEQRLAERTIERDDVARSEADTELTRSNAELKHRLAERTIERDDIARDDALTELARTNAELKVRLAERTIERDDVARDDAHAELARTNAELTARLAERTIERDDIARGDALAELARTNAELKKRLAERTIERDAVAKQIASIELTRTNAAEELLRLHAWELESLNAELESFSYSVSHDLRAPVRAVLGFVRAIEEECDDELGTEGKRLLGIVQHEASRMGNLIDDLLAFSRLGRQPMQSSTVDMNALARDAVAEHEATAGSTQTVVTIADLPVATGDSVLLRQVWVNLISNGFKYASKVAAPELHIWATRAGTTTTYHVRDNGVGFDMRYAKKLFGVFQRLHRADEFPGTGVGLAIVMRVVKRHGGAVRADARIGEGATFSFDLPSGPKT